jgi:hypothetical protein
MQALASKDIEVHPLSLKRLFESSFYTIDFYQREYAWGEEEVRTLVTDLRDAFDDWSGAREYRRKPERAPQYFLGPFVYYEQSGDLRSLVDGQQRFTTLHLIFMALRAIGGQLDEVRHVEMLTPVIRKYDDRSRPRYRVDIEERTKVLDAIYDDRQYESSRADSLSVRNLWERSQDIGPMLREIPPDLYTRFVDWLLNRVVMAGIRASDSNNAFRIFESMNDRGARLTSVDLLKSYLLANVGQDEEKLNDRWRQMLAELTSIRDDRSAPGQFLKATLRAWYSRLEGSYDDMEAIDTALNLWVRRNDGLLGLTRPDHFHEFVERLVNLANIYRIFLHASRNLREGLEEIFFNEKNGLGGQMIAILAAIRPDDTPTDAKEKARRIASFIDRWYVLRTLSELPVQQRDLMELIRSLLPGLRHCRTADDVSDVLARYVAEDDQEQVTLEGFGLRGTNRHQIKYLLARLTAYAMKGCGRHAEVDEYLSETHPYQIEHLFANKPERHRKEVSDELRFRALRNQLGGLVLLPQGDNASLGAMRLDEKISRYGRQNVLVGVLNRDYHLNFKSLREFANENQVERFMRPFGEKAPMAEVVEVRQELYLRLCAKIWSIDRIGIRASSIPGFRDPFTTPESPAASQNKSAMPVRKKAMPRTDVARMVAGGIIQPGTRIVLSHRKIEYWAEICPDGRVKLVNTGAVYTKVDEAGCFVRETRTCDGMKLWCVIGDDGTRRSLREVRDAARAAGTLTINRR